MAQYQILILPVLALALVIFFPIFNKVNPISRSWKSVRRRRTMLARLFVFTLLIATLLVIVWPMRNLSSLVQGLIITAIIMLPFYLAHLFLSFKYKVGNHGSTEPRSADISTQQSIDQHIPDQPDIAPSAAVARSINSQADKTLDRVDHVITTQETDDETVVFNNAASRPLHNTQTSTREIDNPENAMKSDGQEFEDLEQQWMRERVTKPGIAHKPASVISEQDMHPESDVHHSNRPVQNFTEEAEIISAPASAPIPEVIRTPKAEYSSEYVVKLKKLVLSQQAAIKSEREAHLKTQTVTRKAGKMIRNARAAQKTAEESAALELSRRRKVEQQYAQITKVLKDAMAVVEEAE